MCKIMQRNFLRGEIIYFYVQNNLKIYVYRNQGVIIMVLKELAT